MAKHHTKKIPIALSLGWLLSPAQLDYPPSAGKHHDDLRQPGDCPQHNVELQFLRRGEIQAGMEPEEKHFKNHEQNKSQKTV